MTEQYNIENKEKERGLIGRYRDDIQELEEGINEEPAYIEERSSTCITHDKKTTYAVNVPMEIKPDCPDALKDDELNLVGNIILEVKGIVGRVKMPLERVLHLSIGSVVELDSEVGDDVEILVNGKRVAYAEIVAVGSQYGLKLSKILR